LALRNLDDAVIDSLDRLGEGIDPNHGRLMQAASYDALNPGGNCG
jgi:hypothetical protein